MANYLEQFIVVYNGRPI